MNYKEALKDKDYRFRYIYLDGKKVGVVVMLRDGKVGMSFCSPRDQFHKAKGRFMAYQRAVKGKKNILSPVVTSRHFGRCAGNSCLFT